MAPTSRRSGSVCHRLRPLPHRHHRLGSPLPPPTSSSAKNPTLRRGRSASHPATRIPPDGSSSSRRRVSPVDSSAPIANAMKLRVIEGGGGASMGLHRERSSLEPRRAGSAETRDRSSSNVEAMDDADDEEVVPSGKRAPLLPPRLLKFLKDEGENAREDKVRLLAMVVHVLFLDNGFVSFDSLQHGWAASGTLKLRYTLPSLLHGRSTCSTSVDLVNLELETWGKLVSIYGRVPGNASSSVSLVLDTSDYGVRRTMHLWEDQATLDDGEEEEVLEVLKMIKDGLLLPLHIDICDKAGLPSPPCFMRLPTDIQIKILKPLPWTDLGKMVCVCSAMKRLASDDELWKQRYGEVLGEVGMAGAGETSWKDMFGASMRRKKVMETEMARRRFHGPWCGVLAYETDEEETNKEDDDEDDSNFKPPSPVLTYNKTYENAYESSEDDWPFTPAMLRYDTYEETRSFEQQLVDPFEQQLEHQLVDPF